MPDWLERLVWRNAGVEYVPVLVCVGAAVVVWYVQWVRGPNKAGKPRSVRVGWGPGMAVVALVVLGVAAFAVMTGLGSLAWWQIVDDPWLAAWWVVGVGVTAAVWGVAVHAWRGETRLARQCRCGYDMAAVAGMRCPECGRVAKNERQFRPLNVRKWALWVGALVVVAGLLLPTWVAVSKRGLAAALPSRTLLWWMGATGNPPAAVGREALFRCGQGEGDWWRQQVGQRSKALTERMMESHAPVRDDYAALLSEAPTVESYGVAIANVGSNDPERRRSAAALLINQGVFSAAGVPLETVETLMKDPDPTTQTNALQLLAGTTGEIMLRLGDGGAYGNRRLEAERDPERVRQLLRLLCQTPANSYYTNPAALDPLCASKDPETRARAAIMRNRWSTVMQVRDKSVLREALLGERVLRDLKQPSVPGGVSPTGWLGTPEQRAAITALVDDPDPAVRAELLAELDALTIAWAPYIKPGQETALTPLIAPLEARLAVESDAEIKAKMVKVIGAMKGTPVENAAESRQP